MNKRGTIPTELFIRDAVRPVAGMPKIMFKPAKAVTLNKGVNDCITRDVSDCDTVEITVALPILRYHPARYWLKNHHNRMQRRFDTLREEFQQRITGILHCAADEDAVIECCDHALKWLEKKP